MTYTITWLQNVIKIHFKYSSKKQILSSEVEFEVDSFFYYFLLLLFYFKHNLID